MSLGPITPSRKKQQIRETLISQLNECYLRSSTTTCQTPDDEFIRWDDGGMTWRRTVERERGELGFKGWTEAGSCAKDREAWRERTQGPISLRGNHHHHHILYLNTIRFKA